MYTNEETIKDSRILSLEKHLDGLRALDLCEELNNAVEDWQHILEIDTYIEDGVLHITDSTYCDIMTFVRWELHKIHRMYCECAGMFKDIKNEVSMTPVSSIKEWNDAF